MMEMWQTPAIVLAVLIWLQSPPTSLADAANREALRRQMMPKAARSLTNEDVEGVAPRSLPVAVPAAPEAQAEDKTTSPEPAAKPVETHDEAWWRMRVADLRKAVDHDRMLAEALQSRVNALTNDWSARDDPAQRQQLWDERQRTITELKNMQDQILADQKAMDDLQEAARKQGVAPGWLR